MNQKMLEMDNQLAAMTASGWALCNVLLGAGRGSSQLVPHLDEAHFQVDSLISKGVRYGTHATLMLVSSHYGSIDFDVVGQRYAPGKSKSDILAIGSAATRGQRSLWAKCQLRASIASTSLSVCESFWHGRLVL
jgi:hypothetical protein